MVESTSHFSVSLSDTASSIKLDFNKKKYKNLTKFNDIISTKIIKSRIEEEESFKISKEVFKFEKNYVIEISEIMIKLKNIFEIFNLPYYTYTPEFLILTNIFSKCNHISDDAKGYLIKDYLLSNIVNETIYYIDSLLNDYEYELSLIISSDMELENWNQLVFSIKLREDNFDLILNFWEEIENWFENHIKFLKKQAEDPYHLNEIDKLLSIEVGKLENV
ncbi:MAG: hypothetical protein ACTSX4_01750 [Candidatus Helarchaeota archaeon]